MFAFRSALPARGCRRRRRCQNSARKKPRGRLLAAMLEALEPRRLLAIDLGLIALNVGTGEVVVNGTAANDIVTIAYQGSSDLSVSVETIYGTESDVFSRFQVNKVTFFAGDGNDIFTNNTSVVSEAYGGYGDDQLTGGDADDRLFGGPGNDVIRGGSGHDFLGGGVGDDQMFGDAGNDQLFGEEGDDLLYGNDGDDRLFGYDGQDTLWGGAGADFLFGDKGNDTADGGPDDDYVFGDEGDDQLYGGDGSDRIFAGSGADIVDGGSGTDFLFGDRGNDRLSGGPGDDQLFGEADDDWLDGADGDDRLFAGAGNDTAYGGNGNDFLFGEDGDDTLYGEAEHDQIFGQAGDDSMDGGTGEDRIFGGAGNDTANGGADLDYVFGEAGDDVLDGGDGNDFVYGVDGNDTLFGGRGDDALYGGNGNDVIDAGPGNDTVLAGPDDDIVSGGDGNDLLYGEGGNDILRGDAGYDALIGHAGHDILIGGADNDAMAGSEDRDLLIGGTGVDELLGASGDDILNGGFTSYDADDDALRAIRDVWIGGGTYETRVATLESPSFAYRLQSGASVHDDGVVDLLGGEGDRDWFFETGWLAGQRYGADDPPQANVFTTLQSLDNLADIAADERRQTLIAHAGDPSRRLEHSAMLDLFDYREVTHEAVKSGGWSDPATWRDGRLPTDMAHVLIGMGLTVTVDGEFSATLKTVRVDGRLEFDPTRDTRIRVDSMLVYHHGVLQMGTAEQPVQDNVSATIEIADTGEIDRVRDPFAFGRGLIVHGTANLYGQQKTAFLPLAVAPLAGATELQLASPPENWSVGDRIVIAGTHYGVTDHEEREILAIDGSTIRIAALAFHHDVPKPDIQVHVSNLTRNVVVESQNTANSRRGHVMFMHTRKVNVYHAAFNGLGRTNKLEVLQNPVVDVNGRLQPGTGANPVGRYSVHFHRNGVLNDGAPARVHGSVVNDSVGWGYVNHSSFVEMTDNVAFDVDGAGFVTEAGDEIGTFVNNMAIYSVGSGESDIIGRFNAQDFGHQGDGFWLQGPGVTVENNIATGQAGHGIVFFTFGLIIPGKGQVRFDSSNLANPSLAAGESTVPIGDVPLLSFRDNIAYDSQQGAATRYHLLDDTLGQGTVIEDLLLWNNKIGMNVPYTNDTELRNIKIIHDDTVWGDTGLERNHDTEGIFYNNLWIEGYYFGMRAPSQGNSVIQGGYFKNVKNIVVASVSKNTRTLRITGDIQFDTISAARLNGHTQARVMTDPTYVYTDVPGVEAFLSDSITLDFGEFRNARLYFQEQKASFVPFRTGGANISAQYVGKTNQQLWNSYGLALGGAIAPADAIVVEGIGGLVDFTP